jgi:hypothetical protein
MVKLVGHIIPALVFLILIDIIALFDNNNGRKLLSVVSANDDEDEDVDASAVAAAVSAAAAVGVVRSSQQQQSSDNSNGDGSSSGSVVMIDFDIPRYGPICISINDNDDIKFVWNEYHNLNMLARANAANINNEIENNSFRNCDFTNAIPLIGTGQPNPLGYTIEASEVDASEVDDDVVVVRYFACSKICASNGHKVKVCSGGVFGQTNNNECYNTDECSDTRTVDVRTTRKQQQQQQQQSLLTTKQREYVPVGRVCRPKNNDGYLITSGIDTPESCQKKCDDDKIKCGAWEFENYNGGDNQECELHESNIISYDETIAMGNDCEIGLFLDDNNNDDDDRKNDSINNITDNDNDFIDNEEKELGEDHHRCCWIAKDIVDQQTNNTRSANIISSGSGSSSTIITYLPLTSTVVVLLLQFIL